MSKKYLGELLEGKQLSDLTGDKQTDIKAKTDEAADNEVLACLFICLADGERYDELRNLMADHFALGADKYPRDLTSALAALKDFKGVGGVSGKRSSRRDDDRDAGLTFANPGDKPLEQLECFGCGGKGHLIAECRKITDKDRKEILSLGFPGMRERLKKMKKKGGPPSGTQHVNAETEGPEVKPQPLQGSDYVPAPGLPTLVSQQADHMSDDDWDRAVVHGFGMVNHGVALAESGRKTLPWWALFLDSCATYHSMFATKFLTEVHDAPVHLKGHCYAGVLVCEKQGYYGPFKMWLNPKGIANLLSIPQLEADGFKVDYAAGEEWTVKTPKGECIKFKRGSGLFNICRTST